MRQVRSIIPSVSGNQGQQPAEFNRRAGRMKIEGIRCSRGKLLDLSRGGCRIEVRRPWRLGEQQVIELVGSRVGVTVTGECRRVDKVGFMKYAVGMMFVDTDDAVNAALTELVRTHCSFLDEPDCMLSKAKRRRKAG